MRILLVHNRYLFRGGEDAVFKSEVELLKDHGHEVIEYVRDNRQVAKMFSLKVGLRTIWSAEDYRNIRRTIREKAPDITHIHNSFPLISPSAYYAAKKEGIPVVQTLHNYRLLCLNANFFLRGEICERCIGKKFFWPGIINGCYKGSRLTSLCVAAMLTFHRIINTYQTKVDGYIALSEFARDKFLTDNLPPHKFHIKPNFAETDPGYRKSEGKYLVYIGRLSQEKGVDILLEAWSKTNGGLTLRVFGAGPLESEVKSALKKLTGVEWMGQRPLEEIYSHLGGAQALIMPSIWFEAMPRILVECFAVGTPIIASDIGSLAGLVEDGKTGLLFAPGSADELAEKIEWCANHPQEMEEFGKKARQEFEIKYSPDVNYKLLMNIYHQSIEFHRKSQDKNSK